MKRFLAFILAALMLLTLAACSSNGGNKVPQPDNDQNQTDEPAKGNTDTNTDMQVEELFGYSFTFNSTVVNKSSTHGHMATTEQYAIFIYRYDDIVFDVWDNVTEISLDDLGGSLGSAMGFHPTEQTILKVSGTMTGNQAGEGTVERQFIAFYHVTDENYVRFCVGLPKDDSSASYAALDAAMDTLIENLKKAA